MKATLLVLVVVFVSGCATTKTQTHIDPMHKNKEYEKIVVEMPNASVEFEELFISDLCGGLKEKSIECIPNHQLLPPTRNYSEEEFFAIIEREGVEGWLTVSVGAGKADSQYVGSQTFGSANIQGNSVTGSSNSFAMYSYHRSQAYSVAMYDMETRHAALLMDASTSASGLANTTNSVFAGSLANKIIDEMVKADFIE